MAQWLVRTVGDALDRAEHEVGAAAARWVTGAIHGAVCLYARLSFRIQ